MIGSVQSLGATQKQPSGGTDDLVGQAHLHGAFRGDHGEITFRSLGQEGPVFAQPQRVPEFVVTPRVQSRDAGRAILLLNPVQQVLLCIAIWVKTPQGGAVRFSLHAPVG